MRACVRACVPQHGKEMHHTRAPAARPHARTHKRTDTDLHISIAKIAILTDVNGEEGYSPTYMEKRAMRRSTYRPSNAGWISSFSFFPPQACSREIRNMAPDRERRRWGREEGGESDTCVCVCVSRSLLTDVGRAYIPTIQGSWKSGFEGYGADMILGCRQGS